MNNIYDAPYVLQDKIEITKFTKTCYSQQKVDTDQINGLIIKAKDITNKEFSRNININWQYRRYFGVSNKETLLDSDILALTSELSTSKNKTIEYDMTGGNYFYFAYPTVLPIELK